MSILKVVMDELHIARCSFKTVGIILNKFINTFIKNVYSKYSFQNEVYTIIDVDATLAFIKADVSESKKFYRLGLPYEYLTFREPMEIFTKVGEKLDSEHVNTAAFNYFENFCFVNEIPIANEYLISE
jgi:hypothetical protein